MSYRHQNYKELQASSHKPYIRKRQPLHYNSTREIAPYNYEAGHFQAYLYYILFKKEIFRIFMKLAEAEGFELGKVLPVASIPLINSFKRIIKCGPISMQRCLAQGVNAQGE